MEVNGYYSDCALLCNGIDAVIRSVLICPYKHVLLTTSVQELRAGLKSFREIIEAVCIRGTTV